MRSRLEAWFAADLDRLEFGWEYEPRCYAGPNGQWLPDFEYFDGGQQVLVEVKPSPLQKWASCRDQMEIAWESDPGATLLLWTPDDYAVTRDGQWLRGRTWSFGGRVSPPTDPDVVQWTPPELREPALHRAEAVVLRIALRRPDEALPLLSESLFPTPLARQAYRLLLTPAPDEGNLEAAGLLERLSGDDHPDAPPFALDPNADFVNSLAALVSHAARSHLEHRISVLDIDVPFDERTPEFQAEVDVLGRIKLLIEALSERATRLTACEALTAIIVEFEQRPAP